MSVHETVRDVATQARNAAKTLRAAYLELTDAAVDLDGEEGDQISNWASDLKYLGEQVSEKSQALFSVANKLKAKEQE